MKVYQVIRRSPVKVVILGVILSGITLSGNAQSKFKGIFNPITPEMIQPNYKGTDTISINSTDGWFLRTAGTFIGSKFNYSITDKKFVPGVLNRAGAGLVRAHYIIDIDKGEVYSNYSYGAYLLFPVTDDPTESYLSVMVAGSAFKILNEFSISLGVGYDVNKAKTVKENFFLAPNISITF